VDTPTNPVVLTELEPPCSGGPDTGTNEFCTAPFVPEDIGTVTQSQSLQVSGVLSTSGNDGSNWLPGDDWDTYIFTVGETGQYSITEDCFTTTTDGSVMVLFVGASDCSSTYYSTSNWDGASSYTASAAIDSPIIPAGTKIAISVAGWVMAPLTPYRISIDPYFPPPTPTATP
jgi:hypothetical protein